MEPTLVDVVGAVDAVAGPWYGVEVGTPARVGWATVASWSDPDRVAQLLAEIASARRGGPDVAAMFAVGALARGVVIPLVGALWVDRGVLEVDATALHVHHRDGGWFDRVAIGPDAAVVAAVGADRSAELVSLVAASIETLLAPFIEEVHRQAPIGLRGLWATVGDTIAAVLLAMGVVGGGRPGDAVALTNQLLDRLAHVVLTRPTLGVIEHADRQAVELTLSVCCLAYKCEGGVYCGNCPLV